MDANKDGQLIRLHHTQPAIRISCSESARYRVQRVGPNNDERIIRCPSVYVSRSHCEVFRRDRAFWIKDLGSSNGTYLNGMKLTPNSDRELRFKDVIGMGISHIPTDETITVTDEQCYIFKFVKEDEEREVIDLEEDDPVASVPDNASNTKKSKDSDDEDIQIVEDLPEKSPTCSPTKKFKKPMPPPPPPPVISESFALRSLATPSFTSSSSHESTKKPEKTEISASSSFSNSGEPKKNNNQQVACDNKLLRTINTTKLVDHTNKRPLNSEQPQHLSSKRSKKDNITCNSSSDDSSDGLGDVDVNVVSKAKEKHKQTEYSGMSSDDNSSEENDINKETVRPINTSAWIHIPTEKQDSKHIQKHSLSEARNSSVQTYAVERHVQLPGNSEDSLIIRRHNQFNEIKREKQASSSESDDGLDYDLTSSKHKRICNRNGGNNHVNLPNEEIVHNDQPTGKLEDQSYSCDPVIQNNKVPKTPETAEGVVVAKPVHRGIQLLDDAPTPRFAAQAQNKFAFKQPLPPSASKYQKLANRGSKSPVLSPQSPSFEFMSREDQKKIRNDKLKEMELKKQKEKDDISIINNPRRPTQPAKIKVTSKNRNQGLMDSIIDAKIRNSAEREQPKINESLEKISESPSMNNTSPPVILQDPRLSGNISRVVPRDPRLQKNPNNKNSTSLLKQSNDEQPSSLDNAKLKATPASKSNGPINIVKPGANPIFSPPSGIGTVSYREKPKLDVPDAKHCIYSSSVSEDDVNRRILTWRPIWLEEQKSKNDNPPPILKNEETLTTTLRRYDTYDAYFKIYYPLLLFEIWATIGSEAETETNPRENATGSRSGIRRNFQFKIDDVTRTPPNIFGKVRNANNKPPEDDNWQSIKYHTVVKRFGEIDARKDLVILQLKGTEKESGIVTCKRIFGFCLANSDKYDQISKTQDCDRRLKAKGGEHKLTGTVVCRLGSNFVLDKTELGEMTKICNITPKIREFKALNNLRSYRLSYAIIKPDQGYENSWKMLLKKHEGMKPYNMISICQKLNREQMTIVKCVSERVSSDKPELMLMHGPPGTGKTTTIVALVLQLMMSHKKISAKNHRILICTPSNGAVDEIMRRLHNAIKDLPNTSAGGSKINMVRIGDGVSADLKQYAIDACVEELEDQMSTAKSIKAEIAAIEDEIEEAKHEIEELKKLSNYSDITLQAKLSNLRESKNRKDNLKKDLDRVMNKSKSNKDEIRQVRRSLVISNAHIVCSTLSSSSTSVLKTFNARLPKGEKSFICCIVDEASQTTEPETLLPLTLNIDKMLLVGDPHQLGATVLSIQAEDKNYGESLFTRHFKYHSRQKSNPVMSLTRQYRMHEKIAQWPNVYFYESQLYTMYNPNPSYPLRPYCFVNLPSREHSENGKIENSDEVVVVNALIDAIEEILAHQFKMTIGIITPYAAQKQSLQNDIKRNFRNFKSIEIDTVDGFQGQEKDIIILSCVRTDGTGFLKSGNRLNVALTRAKHSLYVIGDARCLSQDDMWRCLIQDAAKNGNKYDVNSDFKHDLKLLRLRLSKMLKKNKTAV